MLVKFLRLPNTEKRYFFKAFLFMLELRVRLKLQSFPKFLAWYRNQSLDDKIGEKDYASIKRAVNRAARLLVDPKKPCLPKALTAYKLCEGARIKSSVVIGIMKEASNFKAHAWLLINEKVALGWLPNLQHYKELTRFEKL